MLTIALIIFSTDRTTIRPPPKKKKKKKKTIPATRSYSLEFPAASASYHWYEPETSFVSFVYKH